MHKPNQEIQMFSYNVYCHREENSIDNFTMPSHSLDIVIDWLYNENWLSGDLPGYQDN